jgi:hypothetical protein
MEYAGYMIEGDGTFGMKYIKPVGRGSVPLELRGSFTTINAAKRMIDILHSKKEKPNAEVNSTD